MADEFQEAHSVRVRQCNCGVTAHVDLIDEDGDIFAVCSVDRETRRAVRGRNLPRGGRDPG